MTPIIQIFISELALFLYHYTFEPGKILFSDVLCLGMQSLIGVEFEMITTKTITILIVIFC